MRPRRPRVRLGADRIVVGVDEAAVLMRNEGGLHDREVGADGLVRAVRAAPPQTAQDAHRVSIA